jgi:DNA-directed RNA polymerase specialized sigma24 family protein
MSIGESQAVFKNGSARTRQRWFRLKQRMSWTRRSGRMIRFVFDVERRLLFAQIRRQLSGRDREICTLLEQDLSSPGEIAKVLQISYAAAAKALQRARGRMASIVNEI